MQLGLWDPPPALPEGFEYRPNLLSPAEEAELLGYISQLDFKPFEFHGYLGNRQVVSFGLHYDFAGGGMTRAEEIPGFLLPLREKAAVFAGVAGEKLEHVLVAQYPPGAGIGWHRDRPAFGDVIGVSLASACRFRLRRKSGAGWQRAALRVEPRSIYLLRGPARWEWQHSIPPGEQLRYSVTFRSVKAKLDLAKEERHR